MKITYIDVKRKIIRTNHGSFIYDNLISTIPLNELVRLTRVNIDERFFKYLSLQIVAILIKKNNLQHLQKQRIYNKSKKYLFHKCVLNSNSSDFLRGKDEFVVQFENSFKQGKKVSKNDVIKNCIDYLLDKKIIHVTSDILDIQYKEVKYGYPIQTIDIVKKKGKIKKNFQKDDIYLLGRFGAWNYINFDKVILDTIKLFNEKEQENITI